MSEEMSNLDSCKEMKDKANMLRAAASSLEMEAINVKHDGEVEETEYLSDVLDEAISALEEEKERLDLE